MRHHLHRSLRQTAMACLTSVALTAGLFAAPAKAHTDNPSAASSALSMLPIALSVVAPVALLSAGAVLTVVAVDAVNTSARGAVWVLERASDGARLSVNLAGHASVAVGVVVVVTAVSTGWLLSQAGKAVLFVPNELGASLLYNERVSP
jgi:hypothetical protein